MNMYPSSVVFDMSPHEVWSGKKPSVAYIKLFGYDAFVQVGQEGSEMYFHWI
jgi:hypothetical protein